jgi:ketosteroid isomerase-like protein
MPDNVQILREIDQAQRSGDIDAFLGYFTDDVQIHAGGDNKLAGDYQGKDQFQELFGRYMEAAGDDYSFDSHAYLADDEHGVVLQTSHYQRSGQKLDSQEALVVHFRDGKVSEAWFIPYNGAAFDRWVGS